MPSLRPLLTAAICAGVTCAGCSGANPPSLPPLASPNTEADGSSIVGSPTEVYERVARGALGCWFGLQGPLKADYIYHADADPPSKGGRAEIVVHIRDRTSDNQKGLRAYRIFIVPDGGKTKLTTENLKLPEEQAKAMEADARRWASGSFGCTEPEEGGWSRDDVNRPAPASAKTKQSTPAHELPFREGGISR